MFVPHATPSFVGRPGLSAIQYTPGLIDCSTLPRNPHRTSLQPLDLIVVLSYFIVKYIPTILLFVPVVMHVRVPPTPPPPFWGPRTLSILLGITKILKKNIIKKQLKKKITTSFRTQTKILIVHCVGLLILL